MDGIYIRDLHGRVKHCESLGTQFVSAYSSMRVSNQQRFKRETLLLRSECEEA